MIFSQQKVIWVTLIIVLLLGLSVVSVHKVQKEIRVLQSELSEFIVPAVTGMKDSKSSLVSLFGEQRTLRLQRFAVETRLNPLFGLTGVNLDAFKNSITALEEGLHDFAPLYAPSDEQRLQEHLYPLMYLNMLHDVEAARRQLILTPSKELAEEYQDLLVSLLDEYDVYIISLQNIFSEFGADRRDETSIGFVGGDTSIAHIQTTLTSLRDNITQQRKLLRDRWKCYQGKLEHCVALSDQLVQLTPLSILEFSDTFPERIQTNRDLLTLFRSYDSTAVQTTALPESVSIVGSSCFNDPATFVPWTKGTNDLTSIEVELANEVVFNDTAGGESAYFNRLHEMEQRYFYQSVTNMYLCPDIAYDLATVSTLIHIRSILQNNPLFKNTTLNHVAALERELTSAEVLTEAHVQSYVQAVALLLLKRGEVELKNELGAEDVLRAEELLGIYHQQSARYDQMITNAMQKNLIVGPIKLSGNEMALPFLFTTRSYQPLLLGFFNNSITKAEPKWMQNHFFQLLPTHKRLEDIPEHTDMVKTLQLMTDGARAERTVYSERNK